MQTQTPEIDELLARAEAGDAEAQYIIGFMHGEGRGVPRTTPKRCIGLGWCGTLQTSQIKEMLVSVVVGVLMLSACTPGLAQTWEMIGRALCVHGSGSFDRPACNGPDPAPAK